MLVKLELVRTTYGGFISTLPSGETIFFTPHAFGSKKVRVKGDGKVGKVLFNHQFYDSMKEAKDAVIETYNTEEV